MEKTHLLGPWSRDQVKAYLSETILPIRLSVVSPRGWPIVVSLWFIFEQNIIWCASRDQSQVISFIKKNPKCGFEIARETPPYFGVRGQGRVTLNPHLGQQLLPRLHDRFLGLKDTPFRKWLLKSAVSEVAIAIRPIRLMTWDYRERMPVRS